MPLIKYNNQSLSSITALPSGVPSGKLKLISSQTASNSASISFTTGLNSTYKVYKFVFVNINPSTTNTQFQFNLSTDGGSNYNVTKTTTLFNALHNEADTAAQVNYDSNNDLAESTSYQTIGRFIGNNSDDCVSGSMSLFNPASTTYVKHFISNCSNVFVNTADADSPYAFNVFVAGYGNTTSAVNAVRFQMSSGNIDAGTIYLYAIDNS